MALAVMVAGLITVVNLTMLGAVAQLLSGVPDKSFSTIVTRWFLRGEARNGAPYLKANPLVEVENVIEKWRRLMLLSALVLAAVGLCVLFLGFVSRKGFGLPGALLLLAISGNLVFPRAYLGSLRRRVERIIYDQSE